MNPLPPLDQENLQSAVHAALVDLTRAGAGDTDLSAQLLIVREALDGSSDGQGTPPARQATYEVLDGAVQQLAERDEIGARVLRYRFFEGEITRQVAGRLHASPDQVNRWQRAAIDSLTDVLMARELQRREDNTRVILESLPAPPYTRLFGMQNLQNEIVGQLLRQGEPRVVAISGIGGIGKTSLAHAAARQIAATLAFEQILWIRFTAEPFADRAAVESSWGQVESALRQQLQIEGAESEEAIQRRIADALHERPRLIIIDNLESEDHTVLYLQRARNLVGPSKFLLTTRARPTVSAAAYYRSIEELDFSDACAMLRYLAKQSGNRALEQTPEPDLQAIYDVTGGNALALQLVSGLAAVMSIKDILGGLGRGRQGPIGDMYRRIYWQAWRTLSDEARALLQAMPLVAESGARPEQLMAISGLPESALWPAVHELFARSLLEVRGTVLERRYSIHRLTETFLRTDIIAWTELEPVAGG